MKLSALGAAPVSRLLLIVAMVLGTQPAGNCESHAKPDRSSGQIVRDVRLSTQNQAEFRVLDDKGQAIADERIRLSYQGQAIAQATSDADGRVTVSGLRPGIHVVSTRMGASTFRFWAHQNSPPQALDAPALVMSDHTVRGQPGMLMGPALVATGVAATALVIVLVGKNTASDHQPTPASP